jgi:hypothetical protein
MSRRESLYAGLLLAVAMFFAIDPNITYAQSEPYKDGARFCRVTRPNGNRPRGDHWRAEKLAFTGVQYHGTGKLWTLLPLNGKDVILPSADGFLDEIRQFRIPKVRFHKAPESLYWAQISIL